MKDVVSQILVGSLTCFFALSHNAMASEKRTFTSSFGAQVIYDDNLYRINKESELVKQLLPVYNFSDTVSTVFVNAGMDWDVSKQNVFASVSIKDNRYKNNAQLDNTSTKYEAKWNWYASRFFSGDLSYNKNTQLANFTDNLNAALLASEVDKELSEFSINWQMLSHWQTRIGVEEKTTEYSVESLALNNKKVITTKAKILYESEAKNTFSLSVSQAKINYENRFFEFGDTIDNKYLLTSIMVAANYSYSEKSKLSTRFTWRNLEPEHLDSGQDLNVSNWGFNISYQWQPTATTRLTALFLDEISPTENINTDFQRSQLINLGVTWQALNKVYFGFLAEYQKRRYEFNTSADIGLGVAAKNIYKKCNVNIVYLPNDNIELRIGYEFNNQRSDLLLRNFDSNTSYASIVASF